MAEGPEAVKVGRTPVNVAMPAPVRTSLAFGFTPD
jgi:hypothetical protein